MRQTTSMIAFSILLALKIAPMTSLLCQKCNSDDDILCRDAKIVANSSSDEVCRVDVDGGSCVYKTYLDERPATSPTIITTTITAATININKKIIRTCSNRLRPNETDVTRNVTGLLTCRCSSGDFCDAGSEMMEMMAGQDFRGIVGEFKSACNELALSVDDQFYNNNNNNDSEEDGEEIHCNLIVSTEDKIFIEPDLERWQSVKKFILRSDNAPENKEANEGKVGECLILKMDQTLLENESQRLGNLEKTSKPGKESLKSAEEKKVNLTLKGDMPLLNRDVPKKNLNNAIDRDVLERKLDYAMTQLFIYKMKLAKLEGERRRQHEQHLNDATKTMRDFRRCQYLNKKFEIINNRLLKCIRAKTSTAAATSNTITTAAAAAVSSTTTTTTTTKPKTKDYYNNLLLPGMHFENHYLNYENDQ
ncbi:hypothetical protein HELRODRAFT_175456 [Helobdella robusta]|uniref:Uncharacterized protein n=1 Tax=Helobdella robusta TaxID=6412 RepID=T1F999_HELRO|nr:hypothetical protein HELRODRAFT_175456 [Helobdella robusta]ESO00953.1 hypothetical protein HELRODRAFT_175456 [Helobdella robusta]